MWLVIRSENNAFVLFCTKPIGIPNLKVQMRTQASKNDLMKLLMSPYNLHLLLKLNFREKKLCFHKQTIT